MGSEKNQSAKYRLCFLCKKEEIIRKYIYLQYLQGKHWNDKPDDNGENGMRRDRKKVTDSLTKSQIF